MKALFLVLIIKDVTRVKIDVMSINEALLESLFGNFRLNLFLNFRIGYTRPTVVCLIYFYTCIN